MNRWQRSWQLRLCDIVANVLRNCTQHFFLVARFIHFNPRVIAQLKAVGCCCRLAAALSHKKADWFVKSHHSVIEYEWKHENFSAVEVNERRQRQRIASGWIWQPSGLKVCFNFSFRRPHFWNKIENDIFLLLEICLRRLYTIHNLVKLIKFSTNFSFC